MKLIQPVGDRKSVGAHERRVISTDGRDYSLIVRHDVRKPPSVPRIVIAGYQPNQDAMRVLQTCVHSIQRMTEEPHELWVVDNNSPAAFRDWLLQWPNLNVILSTTDPLPPERRGIFDRLWRNRHQTQWGSYSNAVALELAAQIVDPDTAYLMTLHQDTMPAHPSWLGYLRAKISDDDYGAAGVLWDSTRVAEGILHVSGYMVDFQAFKRLKLDFYPQLPRFDVGDRAIVGLRAGGYRIFGCQNTLYVPELAASLPEPYRGFRVDRALDDTGRVIFLHLGRGVVKSIDGAPAGKTTIEEWLEFAAAHGLTPPTEPTTSGEIP